MTVIKAVWAVLVIVIILGLSLALLLAASPLIAMFLGILYALVTGGD